MSPKHHTDADEVRELLTQAADLIGNERQLALLVGVSQQAVNAAIRNGRVSPRIAMGVHRATKGKVGGHQLRPDIWRKPSHVPA